MISPADFIRNVNQVWKNAAAQIVRTQGKQGEVQKFIIKGIRPRARPTDPEGKEYLQCLWSKPEDYYRKCGEFFANAEKMYEHILTDHLGEKRGESNQFTNKEQEYRCVWAGCRKYIKPTKMQLSDLMQHVKTHLSAVQQRAGSFALANGTSGGNNANSSGKHGRRPFVVPARTMSLTYEETATVRDERNPNAPPAAAGIPLSAVLILRNLARNVVKTDSEEELLKQNELRGEVGGWNERLFRPVLPRLYEVMAENKAVAQHITSLLELVEEDFEMKGWDEL
jgi:chromatin structure-remodeling complex subunit RSC9